MHNRQIKGDPEPLLSGDHLIDIEVVDSWIEAKIERANGSSAVLVMPNGVQYQITRRRHDEPSSGTTTGTMWSQDWMVRDQIA